MRNRINSIDLLRGLVMIIMALDHSRDFFSLTLFGPEDLTQASGALFMTRWVTHFCAPVFVLLAGTSAFLYGEKVSDKGKLSRFLLTRGLWLVFVELVIVNFVWKFSFVFLFMQVIWAIGWCMVVLAGLIHLPRAGIAAFALVMIFGHNLLDGITASSMGSFDWLWAIFHQANHWIPVGQKGFGLYVMYPLIPWIGVMALGYVLGDVFLRPQSLRRKQLLTVGGVLVFLFVILRLLNFYGDPSPWVSQEKGALFTVFSFLNTTKYPPSLLFLCMTLGPALFLLPSLEKLKGKIANIIIVFGRVPFFYYILHLFVIHVLSLLWFGMKYGRFDTWHFSPPSNWPEGYEPQLYMAYVGWLVALVPLYFACKWFMGVKKRNKAWWVSYL